MLVLLTFFLIICFGYLISNLIIKKLSFAERLGLSYLLGIGLTTLFVFVYSWAGIKISLTSILCFLVSVNIILLIINRLLKRLNKVELGNPFKFFKSLKWSEKIILAAITFVILLSFLATFYYPVNAWDALALYDFRAKIIAEYGFFVQIARQFDYFAHYPLLTSLTHTIVYLAKGTNPQFTYSLYLLTLTILFFHNLRRDSNRMFALIATLLLISTPEIFEHSTVAYTNLPYTVFYVSGLIYLNFAIMKDRDDYLFISSILVGLSTWARSDLPFWITGLLSVLVYSIYKRSFRPILVYFPAFFLIQQVWSIFAAKALGTVYSTVGQFSYAGASLLSSFNLARFYSVGVYLYQNVVLSWGAITFVFLIAVLLSVNKLIGKKTVFLLALIIANFMGLFIGTYIFSLNIKEWRDIANSASRMSMFFPPLLIYYSSVVFSIYFKKKEIKW